MKPRGSRSHQRWAVLFLVMEALAALAFLFLVLGAKPAHAQVPAAAQRYRAELVRVSHAEWGLGAPIAALAAQVHQESGWAPGAVSQVGARGMAQFMPATAAWWCARTGQTAADCQPHNPRWALRALVGYDKWLWDRVPQAAVPDGPAARMWATLRAYNGGLGHWQAEAKRADGPRRHQVDAACGRARRAALHCRENLSYPYRILVTLQPRYSAWGPGLYVPQE